MGGGNMRINVPVSANYASPTKHCSCNTDETSTNLVAINNTTEDIIIPNGSFSHFGLGPVPSKSEVETAISLLQNFIVAVSSSNGSESEWLVQMLDGTTSRLVVSYGLGRVQEAFRLLQLDPSVKRLVVALASDKALWDAIVNNDFVRKLRQPRRSETGCGNGSGEALDLSARILQWIWEITKAKVIEILETFQALMNEVLFQDKEVKKLSRTVQDNEEQLRDKVSSSLLLCVMVLLIVVVARASRV